MNRLIKSLYAVAIAWAAWHLYIVKEFVAVTVLLFLACVALAPVVFVGYTLYSKFRSPLVRTIQSPQGED